MLELGSFSGGISYALAAQYAGLEFILMDDHKEYLAHLKQESRARNLGSRMEMPRHPAGQPAFRRDTFFDLVILRGASFFIMDRPRILSEIYRVLAPGGLAFVGGGYGAGIRRASSTESPESRASSTTGWGGVTLLSTR